MSEFTFKLKSDAKEYPARFGGNEVKLTLPESLDGVRGMIEDGADQDAVILGLVIGQGLRLSKQKRVKDVLASDAVKDMDVPAAIAHARDQAESMKLGAPRAKGEGGRRSKRVAEAEAKAENATTALRETYKAVPAAVRKSLRADFLSRGVFTEEQLGEMDAELAAA